MKEKLWLLIIGMPLFFACNNNGSSTNANTSDTSQVVKNDSITKPVNANVGLDSDFAIKIANGGMLEVKLGQLAQTNASSAAVKQFGQMMVDDHTQAGAQLKLIAAMDSITLPAGLNDKSQKVYDGLSKKTGASFDKDYIKQMKEDHQDVIKLFEKETSDGKNTDIKAWVDKTLPVIQHHLAACDSLDNMNK